MIRLLTALVLLPAVLAIVWLGPAMATLALALVAAQLAALEYTRIASSLGAQISSLTSVFVLAACAAVGSGAVAVEVILFAALLVIGTLAVIDAMPGPRALSNPAAAVFAVAYIGLPLGAIAAIRTSAGPEALILLVLTIVVSDSAQYYTGRAFGRAPLAPSISPKKTREGAIGGLVFGAAVMIIGGRYVFPDAPVIAVVVSALLVVALGMIGDLFESLLKRSAGVKDSSALIPGHGGILDRIDSWLFAGPAYYLFVRYFHLA